MSSLTSSFIFDIDGTLVDSNELHVQSWDRAFRHFGKTFPIEALHDQIGKGSDQYLPEFLTVAEIERFGKELDDYRSGIFRKEYLRQVKPFPKVRELFERIKEDGARVLLASSGKQEDSKYYIDLLNVGRLIGGSVSGDEAGQSKPARRKSSSRASTSLSSSEKKQSLLETPAGTSKPRPRPGCQRSLLPAAGAMRISCARPARSPFTKIRLICWAIIPSSSATRVIKKAAGELPPAAL